MSLCESAQSTIPVMGCTLVIWLCKGISTNKSFIELLLCEELLLAKDELAIGFDELDDETVEDRLLEDATRDDELVAGVLLPEEPPHADSEIINSKNKNL